MLRSKIVTDASVLITFNIAVMLNLNDRVSDDAISRLAARRHESLAHTKRTRHVGGPVQGVPVRKLPQPQPDRGQHPDAGWRRGRAALPEQQESKRRGRSHAQPAGRGWRGGLIDKQDTQPLYLGTCPTPPSTCLASATFLIKRLVRVQAGTTCTSKHEPQRAGDVQ